MKFAVLFFIVWFVEFDITVVFSGEGEFVKFVKFVIFFVWFVRLVEDSFVVLKDSVWFVWLVELDEELDVLCEFPFPEFSFP